MRRSPPAALRIVSSPPTAQMCASTVRWWQQQWRTGIKVFCVCNYDGGRWGESVGRPRPARVKRLTQAAPRRLTDGPARRRYDVGGGRGRITKGGAPPDGCGVRGIVRARQHRTYTNYTALTRSGSIIIQNKG